MRLGPLRFAEIFKPKPWGGRALARTSAKALPPGERVGESWEVADHPHGTSAVAEGPLAGHSLRELVERAPAELVGPGAGVERFPLLVKLIHAREQLSVQVHPDDDCARAMGLADPGKTEAWYVIEARAAGRMVAGLRSRRDIPRLRELALSGAIARRLKVIHPRRGEALLCPAGTVHALGPGLVLLEIQQNSDATFRLYDWGRVGLDGRPREVHVDEAIRAIGDRALHLRRSRPRLLRGLPFPARRLVRCDKFVIDRWLVHRPCRREKDDRFEILHVTHGSGRIRADGWPDLRLGRGRTILMPACVRAYELIPSRPLEVIRTAG